MRRSVLRDVLNELHQVFGHGHNVNHAEHYLQRSMWFSLEQTLHYMQLAVMPALAVDGSTHNAVIACRASENDTHTCKYVNTDRAQLPVPVFV